MKERDDDLQTFDMLPFSAIHKDGFYEDKWQLKI